MLQQLHWRNSSSLQLFNSRFSCTATGKVTPVGGVGYQLVQAYHPNFRQPRMPHAIATRMAPCLISCWLPNNGRGWHSHFFVEDLGLALAQKNVSRPITGLQKRSIIARRLRRKKTFLPTFFSGRAASRCSKACCAKFRANIPRTDCVGPIY